MSATADEVAAGAGEAPGHRGVFIAIEGPEGAGKTTQVERLAGWLTEQGRSPLVTREPGGTPVAEEVRRILLESDELSARTELLLMLASRSTLVDEVIRPALVEGRMVVTDRFHLSTLAYQGYGRELPFEDVVRMNRFATGALEPDLTVLLDVEPEVGAARRTGRAAGPDRIERAGDAFHRRVVEAYRELAAGDARIVRLDATPPADQVHEELVALVVDRFGETFGLRAG